MDDLFNVKMPVKVKKDNPTAVPATLVLYRGFDVNLDQLQKSGGGYILSPHRSEQGAMWFTHKWINGYNYKEYVQGRGKYLLTYPLQCKRHIQTVHYNDGTTRDTIPQEIEEKSVPTENCRYYAGYELPEGWFFSYKMEKFIICTIPIVVQPNMITSNAGGTDL